MSAVEKKPAAASLEALLKPRSIAVIGASRKEATIGNKLFHNLLHQEFQGVVYPVNPNADAVASVKTYPSVMDIPGSVDMAVIITPADTVPRLVEECGQKGVRVLVVISAGFGETGTEGIKKQEQILATTRHYGMRLVGPNCMGVINTAPEVSMNATFSSVFPPVGNIALGTQSGALGLAILEYARNLNIGLSTFVSIGNRADVSSNDLLQYWRNDTNTDVILLYLESFGESREFARIARSITPTKPILVVKSGRTPVGSKAASSHTGALATAEVASAALFTQTGMIRVDTLEELFDTANLLCNQPIPSGRKVVILTNGGGPGIMTADACSDRGLVIPNLSERTISEMTRFLPSRASLTNPVDMTAEASAEQYRQALELLATDDNVDIVIVIFIPPIVTNSEDLVTVIRETAPLYRDRGKTLIASLMGSRGVNIATTTQNRYVVPSYAFPETTATVIAKACEYGDWIKRPKGEIPTFKDIEKDKVQALIKAVLEHNQVRPLWLDAVSVINLLEMYGIRMAPARMALTAASAARAAGTLGFPVAVKLLSSKFTHKTDVGGVVLDLRSQKEVKQAFTSIKKRLEAVGTEDDMTGVIVQQMIPESTEVIIGMTEDPSFGPLIMFGMGGVQAELFRDVTFRIHPLTDVDAHEMIRSVKAHQLLTGWRGSKMTDIEALENLLLRVSALVEDLSQIAELDINPIKVLEQGKGCVAVDARIMLR